MKNLKIVYVLVIMVFFIESSVVLAAPKPTATPTGTWYTDTPTNTPAPPTETPTSAPTAVPFTDFELCYGLNLISLTHRNKSTATADLLVANICAGGADVIWYYDAATKSYVSWSAIDPGTGWDTTCGMPFWVNITNEAGCEWMPPGVKCKKISYDLLTGMNLVSLPIYSESIQWASGLLGDIPDCQGVWEWNKAEDCTSATGFTGFFPISLPSEDFLVHYGYGYWASVSADGTWTPPSK